MRFLSSVTRVVVLNMVFVSTVPVAFADSMFNSPLVGSIGEQNVDVFSENITYIIQQAVDDALQDASIDNDAATNLTANQDVYSQNIVDIEQNCAFGSGSNAVCIEEAAPLVLTAGVQNINALSQNLMGILQQADSDSDQHSNASGSALTTVGATQTVTSDTIVEIFQDCQVHTGVCVQRALPQVLTLASQVIAAAAYNELDIIQQSQSGAVQEARADLAADVVVDAVQNIEAYTFMRLAQMCAVDVGLCVQRALPIVKTAVQQVVDAQADNDAAIWQNGAEAQQADADSGSSTDVDVEQNVETHTVFDMFQSCEVNQGLCLQVDADGVPTFVFKDGEETNTGAYVGNLDETTLQEEYSRESVRTVASGICDGKTSCSMVDRLLFWLFGPEPETEVPTVTSSSVGGSISNDSSASRRGHSTNVLSATVDFLVAQFGENTTSATPSFGGSSSVLMSETQLSVVCSVRKHLLKEQGDGAIWTWTADYLSEAMDVSATVLFDALQREETCPQNAVKEEKVALNVFPVASDGPVSSNSFWNACVRGERMTLNEIKSSAERNEDGVFRTCASYHTQDSWYHPDLHVHFTWNVDTGELKLPKGYVPEVMEM